MSPVWFHATFPTNYLLHFSRRLPCAKSAHVVVREGGFFAGYCLPSGNAMQLFLDEGYERANVLAWSRRSFCAWFLLQPKGPRYGRMVERNVSSGKNQAFTAMTATQRDCFLKRGCPKNPTRHGRNQSKGNLKELEFRKHLYFYGYKGVFCFF